MSDLSVPGIIRTERIDDSLKITFADGKSGLYKPEQLYSMLPTVEQHLTLVDEQDKAEAHQHLDPNDANMTGD